MIPQQQRSPEWLRWRKDKVTATDSAAIMLPNGFKTIGQLFDEKLGLREPEPENEAMARGNELEEDARSSFEIETGYIVFPQVCVSSQYLWMVASLDGLTIEKDVAVEIKCPGIKTAQRIYDTKEVPEYYIPQLQHQMAVTGLNEIYFYSYRPEDDLSTIILVKRNQEYIDTLIEKEKIFYETLIEGFAELLSYETRMSELKDKLYKLYEDKHE